MGSIISIDQMGRIFQLVTLTIALFILKSTSSQQLIPFRQLEQENPDFNYSNMSQTYLGKTKQGHLSVYRYKVDNGKVVRFHLKTDAPESSPLLAVFREVTNIVSAQLPITYQNNIFNETLKTLCPVLENKPTDDHDLSVELSSDQPVNFSFMAEIQENFHLRMETPVNLSAGANAPIYVRFEIPDYLDSVVVNVRSNSTVCMTVSVQPIHCPVFDAESNVGGLLHQTMTKSAAITVERNQMEAFNLVFVVWQDDADCAENFVSWISINSSLVNPRYKNFTVTMERAPTMTQYLLPIFVTCGAISIIYIIAFVFAIGMGRYERRKLQEEREYLCHLIRSDSLDQPGPSHRHEIGIEAWDPRDDTSVESYDLLEDQNDKEVLRAKIKLTVADLSQKTWKQRDQKYNKYTVSLITLCLFYGLPVVQLVLNWQDTVRLSGDLDLCWYNFACARPLWIFFDFNNIFSNVGYVTLGLLFIIMVMEREHRHKQLVSAFPADLRNDYGLPRHNGLLYAMGIALMMEGLLSASYHICPSNANYQFDTSFMYMIGMLGMLQIYQLRHPDINANAHVAFVLMAFFILVAMGGVYLNHRWYWITFSVAYIVTMFSVSIEFYFKGMWRFNLCEMWRGFKYRFMASKRCSCFIPSYKGRFLFLVAANAVNFGYIIWGIYKTPKDFPSFLLLPFIANLFLYMLYYIGMKLVYGETLRARVIVYLATSFICWTTAMWFFLHQVTDWSVTPAISRGANRACILMNFYDNHDVWHFLSSLAIFTSFSILLCIDDDLIFVRRDKIMVF